MVTGISGRMTTAEFTVAPINQVILTGNMLFRRDENMKRLPSIGRIGLRLSCKTIDAPRGLIFTLCITLTMVNIQSVTVVPIQLQEQ
jgi:hypothetical protein